MNEKKSCGCWYSMSFLKISIAAITLMVAKLLPQLLALSWYWYLLIAVVAGVIGMMKLKKCHEGSMCATEKKVVKRKKRR